LKVLLEVKSSFTEDPENVLGNWSENNTDYCTWRGISCDSVSRDVVRLVLSNSKLSGSISPSLGLLQKPNSP